MLRLIPLALLILAAFAAQPTSWVRFGKSVSPAERASVLESLGLLDARILRVDASDQAFARFFGGRDLKAVKRYLKTRVDVVVSPRVRESVEAPKTAFKSLPVFNAMAPTSNPSLLIWISQRLAPGSLATADGLKLDARQPHVIQLGSDFGRYFPLYGLSTLVHEARHSDCAPGDLDNATLRRLSASGDLKALALALSNLSCGRSHSACPAGSAMATTDHTMACDPTLDGPYAVQYAFNRAITHHCADCSFGERALMQIFALDAASRLPLPEPIATTVSRTVNRLPELQKQYAPKVLVDEILEAILRPVDDALNADAAPKARVAAIDAMH